MTPVRAVATTVLALLLAIAGVTFGGWQALLAGILLMNVGAIGIALWRGRSALFISPKSNRDRLPDGVVWC